MKEEHLYVFIWADSYIYLFIHKTIVSSSHTHVLQCTYLVWQSFSSWGNYTAHHNHSLKQRGTNVTVFIRLMLMTCETGERACLNHSCVHILLCVTHDPQYTQDSEKVLHVVNFHLGWPEIIHPLPVLADPHVGLLVTLLTPTHKRIATLPLLIINDSLINVWFPNLRFSIHTRFYLMIYSLWNAYSPQCAGSRAAIRRRDAQQRNNTKLRTGFGFSWSLLLSLPTGKMVILV